jgi:hypothetical protein
MFDESWMKSRILRGCGQRSCAWLFLLTVLIVAGSPAAVCAGGGPEAAGAEGLAKGDRSFAMAFPDDFTVSVDAAELAAKSYFPMDDGTMRLGGCYAGEAYADTNFGSACIAVFVSPSNERDRDCARFEGDTLCGEENGVRDEVVNGLGFKRADMSDAAVGHRLEARDYWIVRDGRRYDIRLFVSYTAIEMYTPGDKREFSREDCWSRLTGILNSFSFR